ncbi:MAG: magnesium chelatase subunit D [Paracoccaceae bacterium]|nr:magnesium chelatase subunit D [Paracoccaceae bacterium]
MTGAEDRGALVAVVPEVLAVDPAGLGGLWLRARPSPLRDALLAALPAAGLPMRRIPPSVGEAVLSGMPDLGALLSGRIGARTGGLLAPPAMLVLPMAERVAPATAARLAQALDAGQGLCLVALDEGIGAEEVLPPALADRLGLMLDLDGVAGTPARLPDPERIAAARARLPSVAVPDALTEALVAAALALGIASLRAAQAARKVARVLAALEGRAEVTPSDAERAAALVYAGRATQVPADAAEPPPADTPEPPDPGTDPHEDTNDGAAMADAVLAAVRAALPRDTLEQLARGRAKGPRADGGAGSGAARRGNRRGRPLPSRPGLPGGGARLDLVATLAAAAPWQRLRKGGGASTLPLSLRRSDFRLRRFEDRSDRLLIFTVDASGSAAVARLAEAKGAVEILLAAAYARRDHVALVSFRGTGAELLLPPTRSLVQARRRLADLPGGGGTPLAAGLVAARELALRARAQGLTPSVILLTDGRANVALDGSGARALARDEALRCARMLGGDGVDALVIDAGHRPEAWLAGLGAAMGGRVLALPRAEARMLSTAVSAALGR